MHSAFSLKKAFFFFFIYITGPDSWLTIPTAKVTAVQQGRVQTVGTGVALLGH